MPKEEEFLSRKLIMKSGTEKSNIMSSGKFSPASVAGKLLVSVNPF
jgi:hypothetical protein